MSETPEMVEKVARALCVASLRDPDKLVPALPNRTIMAWQQFEHGARAAIGEMREPTDEMVDVFAEAAADAREAAREENRRMNRVNPNALAECQWFPTAYRALIDAALATPGEG